MKVIFEINKNDKLDIDIREGIGDERTIHLTVNDNLNDILTLHLQRNHIKQLIKELESFESIFDELKS